MVDTSGFGRTCEPCERQQSGKGIAKIQPTCVAIYLRSIHRLGFLCVICSLFNVKIPSYFFDLDQRNHRILDNAVEGDTQFT
jgi:hypothetical protein